jgi:PAS domain S-box-containing protein
MLGYEPAEFQETNGKWIARLHPDDREPVAAIYRAYINQEISEYRVEFRQQTTTGDWKWILSLGKIVAWDEAGKPLRMLGTHTDISDLKQAESEREAIWQRLRSITAATPTYIYEIDLHGVIRFANRTDATLKPAQIEGTPILDWFPPDQRDRLQPALSQSFETGKSHSLEYSLPDPQGEMRSYLANITPLDTSQTVRSLILTVNDITPLRQAEALQGEMKILEDILEVTLAGYWDWDIPNHTEYLSPTFKAMLGYEDSELPNVPESWQNSIFPEDLVKVWEQFDRHIQSRGREPFYNEVRYRHKDGSTIWVICAGRAIEWDAEGNPLRIVGCHVDITARKQAEEEIRLKSLQLEATNQELESFSYSVSHDLRAPLRHIHGFVNALRQQLEENAALDDPKVVRYLEVVESSSQKMSLLIDGLLTLSRLSRRELECQLVKTERLVAEVISFVEINTEPPTPVKFVVGNLPPVRGDRILLQQVFSNLIGNAVKFSRHHPAPVVEISSLPDGTIFVRDNGAGFSMKYADKLFGAFQRLHSQKEFEGTGIGLAIVQRIIHRHGGIIWAESQPERGATFYFKLGNIKS